eukprot:TRINITY_DN14_c0_g1_i1.p1 TRINITY_DN14_c0_g1~~TRINITY_DN14_c0_g1_i1.p1  ORF type:complete len:246 (-),score=73.05 TRINITY_DN14_c0_g1_i1:103-801(-)
MASKKGGKEPAKDAKAGGKADAKAAPAAKDAKGGKADAKDAKGKDAKGGKADAKAAPAAAPVAEEPAERKSPRKTRKKKVVSTEEAERLAELRKKRTFRKFSYRGVDLDALLELKSDALIQLVTARARRKLTQRGLKKKHMSFIQKLRDAKVGAASGEKPAIVKTHFRNMIIVPEMIGSIIGVHNGKAFNPIEIKPGMVGHYLGEFSVTYKFVKHGKPGIGATHSSRFIPLK